MLRGAALRLGRVFGIEIRVDSSWFIAFALIVLSLSTQYFPGQFPQWGRSTYFVVGLITALLFFLSVLGHELAHSLVSQAAGTPVQDITLFVFGGAARIKDEPATAREEFWMALVGPLTSLFLAAVAGTMWLLTRRGSPYAQAISMWLATINTSLALFNLIPGFPMDGGRVFRSIIWAITGNLRLATRIAISLGRIVSYAFILVGVLLLFGGNWINGLWLTFIGWFVESAAMSSYRRIALQEMLAGHTTREVMSTDCRTIPRGLTLDVLMDQVVLPTGGRCFPVVEDGQLVGLITLHGLAQVPRAAWKDTRVQDVMIPSSEIKSVSVDDELNAVLERMTADDVNQLAVLEHGQLLGMVARDSLLKFIRARAGDSA